MRPVCAAGSVQPCICMGRGRFEAALRTADTAPSDHTRGPCHVGSLTCSSLAKSLVTLALAVSNCWLMFHLQGCKDGRRNQASGAWPSHGALQVLESIATPVNMEDRTALLKAATTYACVLAWRMLHPQLPHCSRLRSVVSG